MRAWSSNAEMDANCGSTTRETVMTVLIWYRYTSHSSPSACIMAHERCSVAAAGNGFEPSKLCVSSSALLKLKSIVLSLDMNWMINQSTDSESSASDSEGERSSAASLLIMWSKLVSNLASRWYRTASDSYTARLPN